MLPAISVKITKKVFLVKPQVISFVIIPRDNSHPVFPSTLNTFPSLPFLPSFVAYGQLIASTLLIYLNVILNYIIKYLTLGFGVFFFFKVLHMKMHEHELGFLTCSSGLLRSFKQVWSLL